MNDEQKTFADRIVEYFKSNNGGLQTIEKLNTAILNKNIAGKSPLTPILSALVYHGILFYEPTKYTSAGMVIEKANYILTDKGWFYESYDKLLQDLKHKQDLENALIESSIASNKSVKNVNKLFWLTAVLAFISAFGTFGTFILELHKQDKKSLPTTSKTYLDTAKKTTSTLSIHDSSKKIK